MTIKRYTPRYKILSKLRQPIWFEKRGKIKKFTRQKWEGKDKVYFPRKVKNFNQDSSTFVVGHDFDVDRSFNLTKIYKYLLQDKQTFSQYYGGRRLKSYQLRATAAVVKHLSNKKRLSGGKVFLHFFENRLEVSLTRLGLVSSLMQSRKLLTSSRVVVNTHTVKNFGFRLTSGDVVRIDSLKLVELLARYLKSNLPFFYFRKKDTRCSSLVKKKFAVNTDFLTREKLSYLSFLQKSVSIAHPNILKKI